jgi:hypothetical protein
VYSQPITTSPPRSIQQSADHARRRIEGELAGLAAVERELYRLDRELTELRAHLVRHQPGED